MIKQGYWFLFLAVFLAMLNQSNSQIRINEVVSSNFSLNVDEDNDNSDWIELYNSSDMPVNLQNMRINIIEEFDDAWILPDTTIPPKGFLLLYCSSKDRIKSDKTVLKSSGIGLFPHALLDGLGFAYTEIEGDFEVTVQITSFTNWDFWANTGLMLRETLDSDSRFFAMTYSTPFRHTPHIKYRDELGTYPERIAFLYRIVPPDVFLGLKKIGDTLSGQLFNKYKELILEKSLYMPTKEKLYVGFQVNSENREMISKAIFRDLEINGVKYDNNNLSLRAINSNFVKMSASNELHTNFNLRKSGRTVLLWDITGNLIDSLTYMDFPTDLSYGRYPDGEDSFVFFDKPSPDSTNIFPKNGFTPNPEFSVESQTFESGFEVTISCPDPSADIYFTLNDEFLNEKMQKYEGQPILINKNSTLKAYAVSEGKVMSDIIAKVYFENKNLGLTILSIVADSLDLWEHYNGLISDNGVYRRDEVFGAINIIDAETKVSSGNFGLRAHGTFARLNEQKSFRLYGRNKYGNEYFEYPFFAEYYPQRRVVLRQASQDWTKSMIRDVLANQFAKNFPNLLHSEAKPIHSYLNSDYWGILFLQERKDEFFFENKSQVDIDDLDILNSIDNIINGDRDEYLQFYDSLFIVDINSLDGWSFIDRNIDINNFIEYNTLQTFISNFDWGSNNMLFWKAKEDKWRWEINDADVSLNFNDFLIEADMYWILFANQTPYAKMLYRILENEQLKVYFLNYKADLLNTVLTKEMLNPPFKKLVDILRPEIHFQQEKWAESVPNWEYEISMIDTFINHRQDIYRHLISRRFDLQGFSNLNTQIYPANAGKIKVSTLDIKDSVWSGKYFHNNPIPIQAVPAQGYKFVGWNIDLDSLPANFDLTMLSDTLLIAYFAEDEDAPKIVINEIMYRAADASMSDDWIELYNNGKTDVDISGWTYRDDNSNRVPYTFPEGTILKKDEYLVVAENLENFKNIYPDVDNVIGEFNFGLGRNGDQVRIFDANGILHDSVAYDSKGDWDSAPNGNGPSLELINPDLDNTLASSWRASFAPLGTPGKMNSVYESVELSSANSLIAYPNPAREQILISFGKVIDISIISIFDSAGLKVELADYKHFGEYIVLNTSQLSIGVYRAVVETNDKQKYVSTFAKTR